MVARHGTSRLYHSVRSLRDLHSLGACGPRCVNHVETEPSDITYTYYLLIYDDYKLMHAVCTTIIIVYKSKS